MYLKKLFKVIICNNQWLWLDGLKASNLIRGTLYLLVQQNELNSKDYIQCFLKTVEKYIRNNSIRTVRKKYSWL